MWHVCGVGVVWYMSECEVFEPLLCVWLCDDIGMCELSCRYTCTHVCVWVQWGTHCDSHVGRLAGM